MEPMPSSDDEAEMDDIRPPAFDNELQEREMNINSGEL